MAIVAQWKPGRINGEMFIMLDQEESSAKADFIDPVRMIQDRAGGAPQGSARDRTDPPVLSSMPHPSAPCR